MEGLLILLGLGAVGWVFLMPLIGLLSGTAARREARELRARVDDLEGRLHSMNRRLAGVAAGTVTPEVPSTPGPVSAVAAPAVRVEGAAPGTAQPEGGWVDPEGPGRAGVAGAPLRGAQPVLDAAASTSGPSEAIAARSGPLPARGVPGRPDRPTSARPPRPPPVRPGSPAPTLETLVGVRGFAWFGGIALFLAVVYLLKYSIDQGWWGHVPPALKVASAVVAGVVALFLAEPLWSRNLRLQAGALAGAGVAILYASLFAARAVYDLLPMELTFGLMVGVTAVAVGLSLRHASQFVAFLGLLGGFATPILLSTGQDRPVALFAYVLVLDAGLLLASWRGRWVLLAGSAGAATLLLQLGWGVSQLDKGEGPAVLGLFVLTAAAFAAAAALAGRREEGVPRGFHFVTAMGALMGFVAIAPIAARGQQMVDLVSVTATIVVLQVGALILGGVRRSGLPGALATAAAALDLAVWMAGSGSSVSAHLTGALHTSLVLGFLPLGVSAFFPGDGAGRPSFRGPYAAAVAALGLLGLALVLLGAESTRGVDTVIGSGALPGLPPGGGVDIALQVLGVPLAMTLLSLSCAAVVRHGAFAAAGLLLGSWQMYAWYYTLRRDDLGVWALPVGLAVALAFGAFPLIARRRVGDGLAAVLAGALAGPVLFVVLRDAWIAGAGASVVGLLPIGLGLLSLLCAAELRRGLTDLEGPQGRSVLLFLAASLGMAGAAVAVQLDREWKTLGFAIEVVVLAALHQRRPLPLFRAFLAFFAAVVAIRLLVNPAVLGYHARAGAPILNWYLYTYGVPIAAFLAAASWLPRGTPDGRLLGVPLSPSLRLLAVAMGFWLLNIEVVDAFLPRATEGETLRFRIPREFAPSLAMSLSWTVYAGLLLGLGILRRERLTRVVGLVLFVLAAGKAFLWDVMGLGGLYRVVSFAGMGVALLVASVALQRLVLREPTE